MNKLEKEYSEKRPWGNFVQYTHDELSTVKIITVEPAGELSLQLHHHRREFWRILTGSPTITIGETVTVAKPGDEFLVEVEQTHRIKASDNEPAMILEIAFGKFDEQDIIRLEDHYGRV